MPTRLQRYRELQERSAKRNRKPNRMLAKTAHTLAMERFYGTQGPASPLRRIDPVTDQVLK
jgi:hypothetical protein